MNLILPLYSTWYTPHFIHDFKVTSARLFQVQQKDEEGEFLQMAALQQNMRRDHPIGSAVLSEMH